MGIVEVNVAGLSYAYPLDYRNCEMASGWDGMGWDMT